MINQTRLQQELAGLPIEHLSFGWKEAQNEPNCSYHLKDGKVIRVVWPAPPTAPQVAQAEGIVQAHDGSAAADVPSIRAAAVLLLDDPQPSNKAMRSVLLAVLSEINALRERDRDRAVDVAAATSLADLKTRWSARATLVDRTAAQAKVVARARINGGEAD